MKRLAILLCISAFAVSGSAFAKGKGGRSGPHYGGGKHTSSHGGHYAGGKGSSHKGGSYKNSNTGNQYGSHK